MLDYYWAEGNLKWELAQRLHNATVITKIYIRSAASFGLWINFVNTKTLDDGREMNAVGDIQRRRHIMSCNRHDGCEGLGDVWCD
jgi:hypothetical protein